MSTNLPGSEALVDRELVERLHRAGRRGAERSELEGAVDAHGELVGARLEALARAGEVVEWNRRWFRLAATDLRFGRVRLLRGGRGLVQTGDGARSYLVLKKDLRGARDGDPVLVRPRRSRRRRRDLPRASVVRLLRPAADRLVGTLDDGGRPRWRLEPFDPRDGRDISIDRRQAERAGATAGVFVEAELEPAAPDAPRRGSVVEVLGPVEEPGVDVRVLLRHLAIPEEFPADALEAAARLPEDPSPEDWRGREDLTTRTAVTIDGGQARDFDDALTIEERPGGGTLLGVHIADVSAYVPEGGALDREAYRRGTSVYFPERAVPMLPEALSAGLCSLKPGVPRLTLSAFLEVAPSGRVRRRRFARTLIRSSRRLTYEEVRRLFDEPADGDAAEYGPVLELLERGRRLMRKRYALRLERGSLDFDLPHGDVILDTDGSTVGVKPGERHDAHRLVEECMLAANEAVARELERRGVPALYRVHEPPTPEKLEDLREILRPMGIHWRGDLEAPPPAVLQGVLREIEGHPEEPFVASLVLRALQRALYEPACRGHYALATRHYTHFTSPIRRYPDLVVHRQLASLLPGGDPEAARRTLLEERLPAIAEHSSFTERRAERAERAILQWKLVRLLADRVGERFTGRVTGVQPFGLFVQLDGYFVDGLLPVSELDDDFYEYDGERHRLVGRRGGRIFRLADEVRVELAGVDSRRRSLDLRLGHPAGDRPRAG